MVRVIERVRVTEWGAKLGKQNIRACQVLKYCLTSILRRSKVYTPGVEAWCVPGFGAIIEETLGRVARCCSDAQPTWVLNPPGWGLPWDGTRAPAVTYEATAFLTKPQVSASQGGNLRSAVRFSVGGDAGRGGGGTARACARRRVRNSAAHVPPRHRPRPGAARILQVSTAPFRSIQ